MSCYTAGKLGAVAFCISTDEREEMPIILDPLQPESHQLEFDLLGRSVNVKLALEQVGQTQLTQQFFNFIDENSILIGFLLPLMVPLLHYGAKLVSLLRTQFFFFADLHRILLGPFWRTVFGMPKDPNLHPSYSLYVYCCDILCISCPEPDEFFHPDNYAQFMRIAWLINPLGFSVVNVELMRQHEEAAMEKEEVETFGERLDEGEEANGEEAIGEKVNGEKANGETANDEKANDEKVNGETANGETANGEKANGEKANDKRAKDEIANGETANGEKANGEEKPKAEKGATKE